MSFKSIVPFLLLLLLALPAEAADPTKFQYTNADGSISKSEVIFCPNPDGSPTSVFCSFGGGSSTVNQGTAGSAAQAWFDQIVIGGAIVSTANAFPVSLPTTPTANLATIATNTTGAATAALQSTGNTSLSSIATNTTGSATSALQTTGNTSLGTIATNTTNAATTTLQTTGNTSLSSIATNTALRSGTPTQSTITCGTSSTTLLSASAASSFIKVIDPPGSSTVWINWAGAAAVTAAPSDPLAAGNNVVWTNGPSGYLPTSQVNCIATTATAVTVVYK